MNCHLVLLMWKTCAVYGNFSNFKRKKKDLKTICRKSIKSKTRRVFVNFEFLA